MNKQINPRALKPSGLNDCFNGTQLSFNEYIELMQNIIVESRSDLNKENAGEIILANSPFCFKSNSLSKNGLLLIHGLFDSPFYVRDLGNYFYEKGFHVKAILLPGHGTVPGDLLYIQHKEWLKAVDYGIERLAKHCEHIYLAGYSMGGLLAIYKALAADAQKIKAILLFAPALKPKSIIKDILARHHKIFSWMSPYTKWYQINTQNNYAKYNSYPFNAGYQVCKVMDIVNTQLHRSKISIPIFVASSGDDETVSYQAIVSFFTRQSHAKSRMILYSNAHHRISDNRISIRSSYFPDLNIINFSHACLTISPENALLGINSKLQTLPANIYYGSTVKTHSKTLHRLTYNPDFAGLLGQIDYFLEEIGTT